MFVLPLAIALSCASMSPEELLCEEAVSRLEDCCPGLDARRFSCETGCNSPTTAVTEQASECIRDRSCDDLKNKGSCTALTRIANEPYPASATFVIEQEACK